MLTIPCPFCGRCSETEFAYRGDATRPVPPLDAPQEVWAEHVFQRDNPRGRHLEYWHHLHGCRQWLVVERDTASHEIVSATLAREIGR